MNYGSLSLSLAFTCSLCGIALAQQKAIPEQDPSAPFRQRADQLISRMTVEEKVSQLVNEAPAIPRLGIPAYDYWSEGLHGVARSGYATLFPQAIGMAATWDTTLLGQIAETISSEARAKYQEAIRHDIHAINYGVTLWSPNINIFRDPRWGRGQETYGEDPYLTSRLGVAFVKGLQGEDSRYLRTVATPKHFAVHSGPESSRHRFNVAPSAHDLEDTYLPAFRATITEAKAASVMCAYNAVDGTPACASMLLLNQRLRRDWKFEGFVVSDCDAIDDFFERTSHAYSPDKEHAAVAGVRGGTDLNCGDTYLKLSSAIKKGLINETELDLPLERVLTARMRLGLFDPPSAVPYASLPLSVVGSKEHQALALEAARKSIVLLKNSSALLPVGNKVLTIAVVGPSAASLSVLEGNYNAVAEEPLMPLDALHYEFGKKRILYAQGSPWVEGAMVVAPRTLFHSAASPSVEGLTGEYFNNLALEGKPLETRVDKQVDFDWYGAPPVGGLTANRYSVRWSGTVTAPATGDYQLNLRVQRCDGDICKEKYAVFFDNELVSAYERGSSVNGKVAPFKLGFKDAEPHHIRVEYSHQSKLFGGGVTLEWSPPLEPVRHEAVAAAEQSDLVIAFVGLSPDLEGEQKYVHADGFEGGDRTDIQLPAAQQRLLEALAATGKPLVVVLLNGSAVAIDWAKKNAGAIVEAWYPGEAGGRAIAETLSGRNNPAGRLPVTFYSDVAQLPAFDNYSMANRTYRYFRGEPLYRFGDGLSFTTFSYTNVRVSSTHVIAGASLVVEADVRNTGKRVGDEVAELYLTPPQTATAPRLSLEGFQRFALNPGETRHLIFKLDARQLSGVDEAGIRSVQPGQYAVNVAGQEPVPDESTPVYFTIEGKADVPR